MPPIVLPPKVYKVRVPWLPFSLSAFNGGGGGRQTMSPAIKGCVGAAREVNFAKFVKVFKTYWECSVRPCKTNAIKVIPPTGPIAWPFHRGAFRLYKPSNSRLTRQDLERMYGWDHRTFVCGSRGSPQ
ncbi:hypothetical protein LXA43DRAFT_1100870 [Ganoderma leucocontextum]|nr:hypothetical protein LXA43DRAFT_1100870 [Ganoderma leucocontextum]